MRARLELIERHVKHDAKLKKAHTRSPLAVGAAKHGFSCTPKSTYLVISSRKTLCMNAALRGIMLCVLCLGNEMQRSALTSSCGVAPIEARYPGSVGAR